MNKRALLTRQQVAKARKMAMAGKTIGEIAERVGRPYECVRRAVLGHTWADMVDPAPVPKERVPDKRRVGGRCVNCGDLQMKKGGLSRCQACYSFYRRHGVERTDDALWQCKDTRHLAANVDKLVKRYRSGVTVADIARENGVSWKTIGKLLRKAGVKIKAVPDSRRLFSEAEVLQARRLFHQDGWRVVAVARHFQAPYGAVYNAVNGVTYQDVGGMPDERAGRRCKICKLLTTAVSGVCRYCE